MLVLKINDRIRNRQVENFNNFQVSLKYDSVGSTFAFDFYFEPNNTDHKELLCIGHYHICTLEFENELILTGNVISQKFKSESARQFVSIGGYSSGGVLEDCSIPPSIYPLQSDGLTLRQIVSKVLQPFNIKFNVDSIVNAEMNSVLPTSTAGEGQSVKSYISQICAQKNIIISHNEKGELAFTRLNENQQPILEFDTTKSDSYPFTSMSLAYDGQGMHSHITLMKQADIDGGNAGESTIRNPYVINSVFRPKVAKQTSGNDNDTGKAARQVLAQELKGLKLSIELSTWKAKGKVIRPGTIISVVNPEVYLYRKSTWVVESVDLKGDNKATTCTLSCVLPETFTNKIPEYLFKGINLH